MLVWLEYILSIIGKTLNQIENLARTLNLPLKLTVFFQQNLFFFLAILTVASTLAYLTLKRRKILGKLSKSSPKKVEEEFYPQEGEEWKPEKEAEEKEKNIMESNSESFGEYGDLFEEKAKIKH